MRYAIILLLIAGLSGQSVEMSAQGCTSPHTTIFNFNNGQDGNMFNVTALKNLYLDSVWCNFDAGIIQEVEIWWRNGTVVGNANSAAGWTKIDSVTNLTSAGPNNMTHVPIWMNLPVNANQVVGLYVTRAWLINAAPYMRYTNGPGGSTAGQLYNQNGDLQISYAYGKDYPFGVTNFNPRIWNGRIFYHCCPPPDKPSFTAVPTQICAGDTFTYSVQSNPFAQSYYWNFGSGTIVGANNDSSSVQVVFPANVFNDTVCVSVTDTCTNSGDTCVPITINPPVAMAGNDTTICSTTYTLQGNAALGTWSVVGGGGTFANANQYNTVVTGLAQGVNTLRWTVGTQNCPSVFDEVNITVNPIAVADFTPSDVCDQSPATFIDQSYALGGNIINWNWDVDGDGTMDYSTNNFQHTYTSVGTYNVMLVATANQGCTDTVVKQITVNPNPVSDFTYTPECEGSPMSFADNSTISSGSITNWEWDFDDGSNVSNAQNPAHVYLNDGWYIVSLTTTSNFGCENTYSDSVEAFSIPDVTFLAPGRCSNDTVFFTDVSTSSQGVINYWEWDFGDGSAVDNNQNTVHNYLTHNLYNVRLTVGTDKGCTNTVVQPVEVYPVPVPEFVQEGVCQKQKVKLVDQSTVDPMFNSSLIKWNWWFADGGKSTVQSPTHFYQEPGFYVVTVTPRTNYGCIDTLKRQILIRPRPEAQALILDDDVCAKNEIHFKNETFFDYKYDSVGVISWDWTFGDGAKSGVQHPIHTYDKGGDYPVSLTVETRFGCIDSTFKEAIIHHIPVADFSPDTTNGCSPLCVTFVDKTQIATGEDLLYNWTFSDGNVSDEVNPTNCFYAEAQNVEQFDFAVNLMVESLHGCTSEHTSDERIIVYPNPEANFLLESSVVDMLDPVVYLENTSIGANEQRWDFGDSSILYLRQPRSHEYEEPGLYTISLLTWTNFGCEDVLERTVRVERQQSFYIPKSFTPNGDGLNDVFEIKGEDLEYVKLWIYDRWGKELFYGKDDQASWDGRFSGGDFAPIGAYVYTVEYKLVGQKIKKEYGNFVISKSGEK